MAALADLILVAAGAGVTAIMACLLLIARRDRRLAGGRTSVAWRIRTAGAGVTRPDPLPRAAIAHEYDALRLLDRAG